MAPTPSAAIASGRIRSCDTLIIRHDDDAPAIDLAGYHRRPVDGRPGPPPSSPTARRRQHRRRHRHVARRPAARGRSPTSRTTTSSISDIAERRIESGRYRHAPRRQVIRPGKVTFGAGALQKYRPACSGA